MMRSLAASIAVAFLTAGCAGDDGDQTVEITLDSGQRDAAGSVALDGGPLDGKAPLDATPGLGRDGGDLSDGSAPACARTDALDPNESPESASVLTLDENGKAARNGVVHDSNPDWFQIVAPRSDPIAITVAYEVPELSTESLQLYVVDALQTELASDVTQRVSNAQLLAVRFEAVSAGSYFARVEATTPECADYALTLDTRVCTDAFEDNDVVSAGAALPSGAQSASVSSLDQDVYRSPAALTAGTCQVQYSVPADSTQQLRLGLFDASGVALARDANLRTGSAQTLSISWLASAAPAYFVVSATDEECTSYTVTCS